METFMKLLETIQTFVWGPPTLVLLMGTGLYFTYKLRGIQICKFPRALKSIFEKEEGAGDVSPFATLCTTLAADIGTGSIVVKSPEDRCIISRMEWEINSNGWQKSLHFSEL